MSDPQLTPGTLQFPLGPFRVVVRPSFWLVMAIFGGLGRASPASLVSFVFVAFVSLLVHELGHAVTGRLFGAQSWIELYSFGGQTHLDRMLSRWRDVAMAASGPAFGFVLGAIAWFALHTFDVSAFGEHALLQAMWINFIWGAMNLLPVLPLDGGRVLAGILGPGRRKAARALAVLVAAAVVLFSIANQLIWMGIMFAMLAVQNLQALGAERDVKARRPPTTEPNALERGWTALLGGDEHEANRLAHLALSGAQTTDELNAVRDLLAWVALADNNPRHAMSQLERVTPPEKARRLTWAMALEAMHLPERALPHAIAAYEQEPSETSATLAIRLLNRAGRADEAQRIASLHSWRTTAVRDARLGDVALAKKSYPEAAAMYARAFDSSRRPVDAYNAACAFARCGELGQGAEWLGKALDAGFDDFDQLSSDPDLQEVRTVPEIQSRLPKPA